ncbi:hypothetical protein PC114_g8390 [Phytophthora cactorum]|nr:hypothetical protein PC114_g8390 [Phytophthora cactorum]KAG3124637.1 hypothetical protein PC128_g27453 [Phytophthora cactorum]KAG3151755.1 hypothetical protein C6341_g16465 [Phytophthora cactorum]
MRCSQLSFCHSVLVGLWLDANRRNECSAASMTPGLNEEDAAGSALMELRGDVSRWESGQKGGKQGGGGCSWPSG